MSYIKILKKDEFIFRILISESSEYHGLEGMIDLSGNLSSTVSIIAVKESSSTCIIYCKGNNHSDFMGIESHFKVKTEML